MGISSSLYAGISGLSTMGNAMNVLGDNIANVNTLAFKSSRATFEDVLSQTVSTAAGSSQIGRGVTLSTVNGIFAQGSFESSDSPTHVAISGDGFFMLRDPANTSADMYTRAGQFRFDSAGYLVNPSGMYVQGWTLDPTTGQQVGSIGDITLPQNSPPAATSVIQAIVNLDVRNTVISANSMIPAAVPPTVWDGTLTPPIAASEYYYASSMKVYDGLGDSHDLTTYFDRTDPTITGVDNQWEFLVTCDPAEDLRTGYAGNPGAGALMYGTITFDANGQIANIDAYQVTAAGAQGGQVTPTVGGYFTMTAAFLVDPTGVPVAQNIDYNFGATYDGTSTPPAGFDFTPETLSSTQFANTSTTYYQDQNGYAAGFLQSVSIDTEGVITGHYSNGQVMDRARLAMATFDNLVGLRKEGGNIFTETSESGVPIIGAAGSNGLGSVAPNALEQSNVDLGSEFVKLITTQRGFQANSKIITTVDEMMAELVNLKR